MEAEKPLLFTKISIHALREEGDWSAERSRHRLWNFYPRPPRGGRRRQDGGHHARQHISIHALREEGDAQGLLAATSISHFYPRPPRGGRLERVTLQLISAIFLSTPSARRATHKVYAQVPTEDISIHALREEGDLADAFPQIMEKQFLSTPSARRATRTARASSQRP